MISSVKKKDCYLADNTVDALDDHGGVDKVDLAILHHAMFFVIVQHGGDVHLEGIIIFAERFEQDFWLTVTEK